MTLPFIEAAVFFPFILVIGLWTAYYDMREMKITNKTVLALAGVFILIGWLLMPLDVYGWRLLSLVIVLVITFILNAIGVMGGGDSKFIAAAAPFVAAGDWGNVALILSATMISALILLFIAKRTAFRTMTEDWKCWSVRGRIPLGLALGSTMIIYHGAAVLAGL